jgi:1-acyl-sn-glycerol-3-phosphate acyltransferase
VLLVVYYLLKIFSLKKAEKNYVYFVTNRWARFTLFTAGVRLSVSGRENAQGHSSGFVVISNHQGNFDIPVFIASLPFSAGFIAKKELMKMPFLSTWMNALDCVFIDRRNPRESREKLIDRIKRSDKNPIFLFPEGTRSKGMEMGPFKTGSLKLLFLNRIDVLPVTISGSYKCYEKYKHVKADRISVTFHSVIHTSSYGVSEFEKYNMDLQKLIASPLIEFSY